ncbi:MAG: hypothetical protein ACK2UB_04060, partial [Anaerolineales bacterium]
RPPSGDQAGFCRLPSAGIVTCVGWMGIGVVGEGSAKAVSGKGVSAEDWIVSVGGSKGSADATAGEGVTAAVGVVPAGRREGSADATVGERESTAER